MRSGHGEKAPGLLDRQRSNLPHVRGAELDQTCDIAFDRFFLGRGR